MVIFCTWLHGFEDLYNPDFMAWCLQTKEAAAQPYTPIISLGMNCQVAYQLRIHGLRYESYPFDWLICPADAMIALIENNFEHFLEPQYLQFIHTEKEKHILNTYYNIKFIHDFKLNDSFMDDYEHVCQQYSRRIQRFYQKMNESSRALLFRKNITHQQTAKLTDLLHRLFPHNSFLIVAVDNSDEIKTDWQIANAINYFMPIIPGQNWKGDDGLWAELFAKLNLNICSDQPQDALFKEEDHH